MSKNVNQRIEQIKQNTEVQIKYETTQLHQFVEGCQALIPPGDIQWTNLTGFKDTLNQYILKTQSTLLSPSTFQHLNGVQPGKVLRLSDIPSVWTMFSRVKVSDIPIDTTNRSFFRRPVLQGFPPKTLPETPSERTTQQKVRNKPKVVCEPGFKEKLRALATNDENLEHRVIKQLEQILLDAPSDPTLQEEYCKQHESTVTELYNAYIASRESQTSPNVDTT